MVHVQRNYRPVQKEKLFGETAGHLYPKDQMVCTCTKSKIGKGRAKIYIFSPPNKGTRFIGMVSTSKYFNR